MIKYFMNIFLKDINGIYKVYNIEYDYIIIKNDYFKFVFKDQNYNLKINDEVKIEGWVTNNSWNDNNYFNLSKKINGSIKIKNITIINSFLSLKQTILDFTEQQNDYFKKYFLLLTFGYYQQNNDEIFNLTKNIGIMHIIIISGFHFSLIYRLISKIIKFFNIKHYQLVAICIISIYFLFVNKSASSLRAYLAIIYLYFLDKYAQRKFKLIISFHLAILLLFLNPYYAYLKGFWYTFLITFFIDLFNYKFKFLKNKLLKYFFLSILINIISLMLNTYFLNTINLLSIVNIFIITPVVEFIIINSLLFWFISPYLAIIYYFLETLLNILSYVIWQVNFNNQFNYFLIPCILFCLYWLIYHINFYKLKKINFKIKKPL
ncbi:MAG0480 family ComEC-like protein [Mycoplasmopsis alligatoris]|uniref:ComEC/Rec2-like protein n=1 Tax=Mycoplasmopsis alligatoris A21JP2 TaxID=747682 RepID=D4XVX4_9BACT|nr:ComEC/Rec2 family competence protein [Mycoplasmopsis alligatoris]EFF41503.1 ComEC/Rec2-like protein [Mycoplasmopsis alligatoris A21JP2]